MTPEDRKQERRVVELRAEVDTLRRRIADNLPIANGPVFEQQSLREAMIETHRALRSLSGALEDFRVEFHE